MKTNGNSQTGALYAPVGSLSISRRRKGKRLRTTLLSVTLMGAMVVGSIMAYLIDVDSKDSKFEFSKGSAIDIELVEENFTTSTTKNVMPNSTYTKDPKVSNTGTESAYVFMQVEVPMAEVQVVNSSGTVEEAAETELFTYEVAETSGWTQLGTEFVKTEGTGSAAEKYTVYTYVYGTESSDELTVKCTKLAADDSTSTLFDNVKVINYVGANTINGKQKDVIVTAYAIQTENLSATTPEGIWALLASQSGAATATATDNTGN